MTGSGAGRGRRADIDGDDQTPRISVAHLAYGEVVDDAAVHEEVTIQRDRRHEPRNGDTCSYGRRQPAALVDDAARSGEAGRHAEVGKPEVLDVGVTQRRPEPVPDALRADHRRARKRV